MAKIQSELCQELLQLQCWFQSSTQSNKLPEQCKPGCTKHQTTFYTESLLRDYKESITNWNDEDIKGNKKTAGHSYCCMNCYQHKQIKGDMHYCAQSSPTTWVQHFGGNHDAVCIYWGMLSVIYVFNKSDIYTKYIQYIYTYNSYKQ